MAESKYKKYDGRFWNKQLRQIRYDEKEDSKTVMKFLNPILNIITFGNLGNIRRRRKIKIKIKKDDLAKPQEIFLDDELPPILYKQEKDGDFIINGVNDRNTIESLTSLTGLSTSELEKRMWPDDREFSELKRGEYHGSNSGFGGFIKPGESLLEIMARDNDLVLDMGYTHQQVAKPMFQILNAYILADYHRLSNIYFTLNGKKYQFVLWGFPMFQDSPFNDGINVPGQDFRLRKLDDNVKPTNFTHDTKRDFPDDGKSFFFTPLHPYLISRYGFYEGNVDYRMDPEKTIKFFYE